MNTLERDQVRFIKLPPLFQKAISNFDYDKRLSDIQHKFNLHIDQSFALEKAIADLIFGEITSDSLIQKVETDLHLSREKSEEICIEVNGTILVPIRLAIQNQ